MDIEDAIQEYDLLIKQCEQALTISDTRTIGFVLRRHLEIVKTLLEDKQKQQHPTAQRCKSCGFTTRKVALFCPRCVGDLETITVS
jgi:predicted Zn-ribbon and HTH transcriptional regulator